MFRICCDISEIPSGPSSLFMLSKISLNAFIKSLLSLSMGFPERIFRVLGNWNIAKTQTRISLKSCMWRSQRMQKMKWFSGRVCPTCAARAVAREFSFKVMNVFGSTREPPESTKIDSGIRSGSSTFPHIEYLQYSQFLGTWVCLKSSTICKITYGVSEPSILRKTTPDNL